MEAPKTLRRPANWQDFESLCKKLWGEIWDCPEIQKNGRLGQEQSGVDVFGIPFGEDAYYGIQCKGKNEYNDNQFTTKEIDKELEKAKEFEPKLKKYYLATTAQNDSKIQAYVRTKNIDHINKGLFEVHLFCWETIVDLIDENKLTYEYYVKSQGFKLNKSVELTFQDNSTVLTIRPKFQKRNIDYKQKILPADYLMASPIFKFHKQQEALGRIIVQSQHGDRINHSYSMFDIRVHNTGDEPIENYKVFLQFEGDIIDLSDTNIISGALSIYAKRTPTTYLWSDSMTGKIIPKNSILVGDDSLASEDIYLKPEPKESEIKIKWKLISKDLKEEGELKLIVIPVIEIKYEEVLVEDPLKVKLVAGEIEDYIVDKKEDKE